MRLYSVRAAVIQSAWVIGASLRLVRPGSAAWRQTAPRLSERQEANRTLLGFRRDHVTQHRLGVATHDRRAARHEATKREIVAAAWQLSLEHGLAGWSLKEVGAAVGMRAPSLYVYFDGKNELYDAMFADGCLALTDIIRNTARPADPRPPCYSPTGSLWTSALPIRPGSSCSSWGPCPASDRAPSPISWPLPSWTSSTILRAAASATSGTSTSGPP